jgi:hypothetical protein
MADLQGLTEGAPRTFAPGESLAAEMAVIPGGVGTGTAHVSAAQWTLGASSQPVRDLGGLALTVIASGTAVPPGSEPAAVTRLLPIVTQPVREAARIRFTLARNDAASVDVYDASGRLVAALWRGASPAGLHEIDWPAGGVASGTYWVRLAGRTGVQTERLVLIR